jgi:hypothetical protein
MLNTTIRARFEALRSLAGTTPISNAYLAIGTPLTQPARIIKISNETDINILISADGVTDMDFIPANGFILYDLGTNRASMGSTLQFAAGTQFYAKRAGAADSTSGFVYLTVIYAGI